MDLHKHLPYRLAQISLRIKNATTDRFVRNTGISAREWRVLGMLGIMGSRTPSELSELTGMDRATISRATARLVQLDYVQRTPNTIDNRSLTIALTARGDSYCRAVVPRMARSGAECRSLFTAGEFTLFIELLDRMDTAIADGRILSDAPDES